MNKHFIGVIVFSLIVGVTAFIAGLFVKMPTLPAIDPVSDSNEYVYRGNEHSRGKKKKKPRPKINDQLATAQVTQAVFDVNKKQLDTQFAIERANESTESLEVRLHFFVNDGFGVQHIASETVALSPNFDIGDHSMISKVSSFKWLNNLQARENLYVMAEVVGNDASEFGFPAFDPAEATAVLLSPRVSDR